MDADISWTQIFHGRRYFHGREYFMGANISWARIFHGREYFDVSGYFVCKLIVGGRRYFMIFAVSSVSSIFAISFA